jgi:hypothetical protein
MFLQKFKGNSNRNITVYNFCSDRELPDPVTVTRRIRTQDVEKSKTSEAIPVIGHGGL